MNGLCKEGDVEALPGSFFPPYPLEDQRVHGGVIADALGRVLESGSYILGGEVARFEGEFARYLGVRAVVGVGSGTDAIEVMLRALGIGVGDRVCIPALAPSAVAAGVVRSGAGLVFADVDPGSFTLCPGSLAEVLRSEAGAGVKAVLVVHLNGCPADWAGLERVAAEHGVPLLEDCAQAHGARWRGRMVGTLGLASAFSFYPTKNLAALGDAGAVATGDVELAERMRLVRQYGWRDRGVSVCAGVNSRLDELQAAVLLAKLPHLEAANSRRRALAALYDRGIAVCRGVTAVGTGGDCLHAYHQYVVRSSTRGALLQWLQKCGVPAWIGCRVPLHLQPAFRQAVCFPGAESAASEGFSLPLHPHMGGEVVGAVCKLLERFGNEAS